MKLYPPPNFSPPAGPLAAGALAAGISGTVRTGTQPHIPLLKVGYYYTTMTWVWPIFCFKKTYLNRHQIKNIETQSVGLHRRVTFSYKLH